MEENWIPKKGEKVRVSTCPLLNGNKGVIVQFKCFMAGGGIIDFENNRWSYVKPYESEQTWKDVMASNWIDPPKLDYKTIPENVHSLVAPSEHERVNFLSEHEQQEIKEKLMPELNKEEIKDEIELSAAIRRRDELAACHWIPGGPIAIEMNAIDFAIAEYHHKQKSDPVIGKEYEFWDEDGRSPENLIFVGKSNDLFLGCYKDAYELMLKKYPVTVTAWKGIREVKPKEPIRITINQVLEKFNISKDDKVILEGNSEKFSVHITDNSSCQYPATPDECIKIQLNQAPTKPGDFSAKTKKVVYEPYGISPKEYIKFKLDEDGFTDKTDIFDNKQMD